MFLPVWIRDRVRSSTALMRGYRHFKMRRDLWRSPRKNPGGFLFCGPKNMESGAFEEQETRTLATLLDKCDLFVNIGANTGYYCCQALARGVRRAIAVEPDATNLRYLRRNIEVNGWKDICEVVPVAVSDRPGVVTMYGGGTVASLIRGWAGNPDSYVRAVPATTLDELLGDRLRGLRAVILVDVEGAEHLLLQGAGATLQNEPRPTWLMEVSVSTCQPKGVRINPHVASTFEVFRKHGYQAWTLTAPPVIVTAEDVGASISAGEDIKGTNNFMFVPTQASSPGLSC